MSKNGILLLNVGPMADGTFSDESRESVLGVGDWLKVNGEAIYGSSPWYIFGEGPTVVPEGHHSDHFGQLAFTSEDIRFSVNHEYLYATVLGQPEGSVNIQALNSSFREKSGTIESVSLLGSEESLSWRHTEQALEIEMPSAWPCDHANVFKIRIQ